MSWYSKLPQPPGNTQRRPPKNSALRPGSSSSNTHLAEDRVGKRNSSVRARDALSVQGQIAQGLAIVTVAWIVANGGFKSVDWIQQQLKPFCDSVIGSSDVSPDDCIPCPQNGFCVGGRLECSVGFRRIGKTCVEDEEIDQTAEKIVGHLRDHICGLAALALCEGASGKVWVTDAELQARFKEGVLQEQFGLDGKVWTLLWEKTTRIAGNNLVNRFNQGVEEFGCPVELVQRYKPVKCRIREWIEANLVGLLILSPVVAIVAVFIIKYLNRMKTYARAEAVYHQVCEALEEMALEAETTGGEAWVVVSRLRDHILGHSERKWAALWVQVESFVQEDSRIDQYQRRVKGEMKIVWEWQVEGALRTPGVRNKGRLQKNSQHDSPQP